jgi:uncharacterized protein DUF4430/putative VirB-like lipoprotein
VKRLLFALLAALLLAGCGEERAGDGTASLWITRDRGEKVVLTAEVPAGLTAMEALRRKADVETRFGGRFVQSINGIEGSLTERRDWFYYVNGYDADRGATEYRLHDGDILWWDLRSWGKQMRVPVVVGAFPEPFLHGYGGERRPAAVRYTPAFERPARALGRILRADSVARWSTPVPDDANVFYVTEGLQSGLRAAFCDRSGEAGDPVCFTLVGDLRSLMRDPTRVRYRYEVVPWR